MLRYGGQMHLQRMSSELCGAQEPREGGKGLCPLTPRPWLSVTHLAGLCWGTQDTAQQRQQQHGACKVLGALGEHPVSLREQNLHPG